MRTPAEEGELIITCPSCKKRYAVADAQLEKDRVVQCMSCGAVWNQDKALQFVQEVYEEKLKEDPPEKQNFQSEKNQGFFRNLMERYPLDWIVFGIAILLATIVMWSERANLLDALTAVGSGGGQYSGANQSAPPPGSLD